LKHENLVIPDRKVRKSQYQGESLNKNLQGPDMMNNLIGVLYFLFTCLALRAIHIETANSLDTSSFINALIRFRQEIVAFSCDIEAMFHQFYVKEEVGDYMRFLWWKDGILLMSFGPGGEKNMFNFYN